MLGRKFESYRRSQPSHDVSGRIIGRDRRSRMADPSGMRSLFHRPGDEPVFLGAGAEADCCTFR